MSAHVTWAKGGEAWVLAASQDAIVLRSTTPSPPGSRIDGTLCNEGEGRALRVKIHASKRQEDGTFRLEGRPLDLTREARAALEALAASASE